MKNNKKIFPFALIAAIFFIQTNAQPQKNINSLKIMSKFEKNKNFLEILFSKTKILCFGRYAITVPIEAELISGGVSFPSKIEIIKGGILEKNKKIKEDIENIKYQNNTAEIAYNGIGPIENSWQIQYYDGKFSKEDGNLYFKTYIEKGDLIFTLGGSIPKGGTVASAAARQATRAKSLRLRDINEIPDEPGYCLVGGFMRDNSYDGQEMVNAGLYFPSYPDVTFSITSNKNAYGDFPPAEFEKKMRPELSLLARIQQAKDQQGKNYPARTLLREGKRDVQHWHGEESLIRRTDGVHDFEWTLVGTPKNIANPSVLEASMFTKVQHNLVGAAKTASLTDEEAIALWDKLLSGLKFRVKVPGAPPGSYYIDPDKPAQ